MTATSGESELEPEAALGHWRLDRPLRPAPDGGLINRTWLVGEPPAAVLQWVNPIFDPTIHLDVDAVTRRLEEAGLTTPRLLPAANGELWIDAERGCWRMLSYVEGTTHHHLKSAAQAAEAGRLVGRFHAALATWPYVCRAPRRFSHDTASHMTALGAALEGTSGPLAAAALEVGAEILDRWSRWDGERPHRERLCHGDLKVSNLRFDTSGERARCLIDLDTLGPMSLDSELGDAWRSWCNPAAEDEPGRCAFDLDLFAASARAFLAAAPPLDAAELRSLAPAVERICLELAARFCADAVIGGYFLEDRKRFPQPGSHNLQRARCQLRLACSAHNVRDDCEQILRTGQRSSRRR